jgi:cobalt-zinc-cadmium efflux system protein
LENPDPNLHDKTVSGRVCESGAETHRAGGEESHEHHSHGGSGHAHNLPATFGKAFAIGITLNIVYVVAQVMFGFAAHSLALLADAGHNLGDVMGLFLAWGASILAQRRPTSRYTYGLRRSTILASLANAILLLVAVGGITWEAIRRFGQHEEVAGITVIWVAALGVVINGVTALLFVAGRERDLNIKGAFLHMAADAAVSAGVVLAGLLILISGWWWLDPIVSLLINAVIVWGTWGLLRDSLDMTMDAVPAGIDVPSVQDYLRGLPGITDFHHLHIWPLSTTETALTVHLVKPQPEGDDELIGTACRELSVRFRIDHATIQFERCGPIAGSPGEEGIGPCK